MNSRPYYQRAVLPLLMIMVATVACFCSWTPGEACMDTYGGSGIAYDDPQMVKCREHVTSICGEYNGSTTDIYAITAHRDCVYSAAVGMQQQALSAGGGSCAGFRLTSPLDGLANGVNTFYWDPYPGATGYQIQLLESGQVRATFNANSSQTNLTADLSINAIGQGSMFIVRAKALIGPSTACTVEYFILRGAPPASGGSSFIQPPVIPTQAPICDNDFICEADRGEDALNCPADCAPK